MVAAVQSWRLYIGGSNPFSRTVLRLRANVASCDLATRKVFKCAVFRVTVKPGTYAGIVYRLIRCLAKAERRVRFSLLALLEVLEVFSERL